LDVTAWGEVVSSITEAIFVMGPELPMQVTGPHQVREVKGWS
jgi:hypothetical protein